MVPILVLVLLSVLMGIGLLLIFRWTVDPEVVRARRSLVWAHLMELRLFTDEPSLIWKAHGDLIRANLRYMAVMLKPALFAAVPMLLVLSLMDVYFGKSPLQPGEATLVTVQLSDAARSPGPAPVLTAAEGIAVETPAVRQVDVGRVGWRVRAQSAGTHVLKVALPDEEISKTIEVGPGFRAIAVRRVRSPWEFVLNPGESLLPSSSAEWIEVKYESASVDILSLKLHWLIWCFLIMGVTMLILRSRFNVTF